MERKAKYRVVSPDHPWKEPGYRNNTKVSSDLSVMDSEQDLETIVVSGDFDSDRLRVKMGLFIKGTTRIG